MKVVILQSSFLPWLGFFDLVKKADKFVFLDDVQYTIRDWRNRNRIRTANGWGWLSVPVVLERSYYEYKINEIKLNNQINWKAKHLNAIVNSYNKSPYFDQIFPELEKAINKQHNYLVELNHDIIYMLCDYLGLNRQKFVFAEKLEIPNEIKSNERLIAIMEKMGGVKEYLSGVAAKSYLKEELYEKRGIKVLWQDFPYPYYQQLLWGGDKFISHLSVLDLLFNHGKESLDIISGVKIFPRPPDVNCVRPEEFYEKNTI
ncbi:MAG: WbqC family protein [bacterium]